jgi:hypothetical protein
MGTQVVAEAFKILKVVEKHTDNTFNFQEHLFGGVSLYICGQFEYLLTSYSAQ